MREKGGYIYIVLVSAKSKMRLANFIELRVFSYEGEDENKIIEKLKSLVPFDLQNEKVSISQKTATGFNEKTIRIFGIRLEKERHTNKFIENLASKLTSEQKELLVRQAETRLDTEFNFFVRFDKTRLLKKDELWLTDSGNCYHIKINIACFPRTKENAIGVIRNVFK